MYVPATLYLLCIHYKLKKILIQINFNKKQKYLSTFNILKNRFFVYHRFLFQDAKETKKNYNFSRKQKN